MDLIVEEDETLVFNDLHSEDRIVRIVVTDASTEIALALLYRIFAIDVFGENQLVFVTLYEVHDKAMFLESVAIELTSHSPNLLHGVNHTRDPAVAFKNADVVFSIGTARGYEFGKHEHSDIFFKEFASNSMHYGNAIEKYAKKDVKVIVLGNTAATVISRCFKSIPTENVTSLSMFNLKMTAAHIAYKANCIPTEIKNIIIWGTNGNYVFPDCRYLYFTNGQVVTNDLEVWIRNDLPHILQNINGRPWYTRSLAYGLADHCKVLWNGTPENEWTCMGVLSDNSYGVRPGIFFSYPVICKDRRYEIVQGLIQDEFIKKCILDLSKLVASEARAALKICGL